MAGRPRDTVTAGCFVKEVARTIPYKRLRIACLLKNSPGISPMKNPSWRAADVARPTPDGRIEFRERPAVVRKPFAGEMGQVQGCGR